MASLLLLSFLFSVLLDALLFELLFVVLLFTTYIVKFETVDNNTSLWTLWSPISPTDTWLL